jgi:hypothetical protein
MVGEYIAKDCAHLKKKQGCMLRGDPKSILGKINKHVGEGNQKNGSNENVVSCSCPW